MKINMGKHNVVVFRPYPFEKGQKLHIEFGPRSGDWEVVDVDERKVKLRCPVSFREFEWDRFCYFVELRKGITWPI
jgi:hypothetical protein